MKKAMLKSKCDKCTHEYEKEYPIENTDQLLNLMDIYLSEWTHRDSMLWKQIFTYFFATLVVMILPFANIWEFSLGDKIASWIFPAIGILMSLAFFIIGKGYAVRLTAIGKVYDKLIQKLPKDYRRIKLEEINPHSLANMRMSFFIVYLMSILLTALGIVLLIISLVG